MRLSLTWSDPKHADQDVREERKRKAVKDELFERQMAFYYSEQNDKNEDNEEEINVQSDCEETMYDDESNESEEDSDENFTE